MNKEKRLQPNLPLGFVDRSGKELAIKDKLVDIIKKNLELFGFSQLETPSFEISENIGKFLPDEGRPMSGVFGIEDNKDSWISLRYDLTAPLARYVSKNVNEISNPFKRYQIGTVWRNEKPGPGRFREFTQIDADIVGSSNESADAEMCYLLYDTLKKIGFIPGYENAYLIKISNRNLINGLLEENKITNQRQKLITIRTLDKVDRIGLQGVQLLLADGRQDKSGDFTKGAGLSDSQISNIINFVSLEGEFSKAKKFIKNPIYQLGIKELENFFNFIELYNYEIYDKNSKSYFTNPKDLDEAKIDPFRFSPNVVRGLEYYTGTIFEASLTFPIKNKKGEPVVSGSTGGGGRYDKLISRFKKIDYPATGVSIGLDRLLSAIIQYDLIKTSIISPIVICVLNKELMSKYYEILRILRDSGINSEIYNGDSSLKAQLKYADKRNSPAVIMVGDDEKKNNTITIKNLKLGKKISSDLKTRKDWTSSKDAQITTDLKNLVYEIKKII